MTQLLDGKVMLITGGASGIGRAAAQAGARAGATVVLSDVSDDEGERVAEEIRADGGRAGYVHADVCRESDVRALVERTVSEHGSLDCAFNNAGIEGVAAPLAESSEEIWDRVLEVNLKGVWCCMQHEIRQMLRQERGAIVNASSVMGVVASRDNPAYAASKHGVVGLTHSAALDYAEAGIRVNAVAPGYIRTPMLERLFALHPDLEESAIRRHPMGRLGTPEEIAQAVVWLCSDAASFVTGQVLPVDGGYLAQ
ncbi:MAG: SDR family oxidoreductase [Acidobacteria bacterium]|nr:MAG: SDR family oxidoreductase [Acidobacteriota bacterium]